MPAVTVQRDGLTHMIVAGNTTYLGTPIQKENCLMWNMVTDLVSQGFTEIGKSASAIEDSTFVKLKPPLTVDPLWNESPWHILFQVKGTANMAGLPAPALTATPNSGFYMRVGSPSQIPASNNEDWDATLYEYPIVPARANTIFIPPSIASGTGSGITPDWPRLSHRLPASYNLTVTGRGFAFILYAQAIKEDTHSSAVMCIQRGVGCNGTIGGTVENPLFLLTNVSCTGAGTMQSQEEGPRDAWYYSIPVSKSSEVAYPPIGTIAGQQSPLQGDSYVTYNSISHVREGFGTSLNYFPNRWPVPVTTDTGEYILMFPFGLSSQVYSYTDEIDLIAISKGNAYQFQQEVPVNVYGEERAYTAFNSNTENSSLNSNRDAAIRIFLLTNGPEFS